MKNNTQAENKPIFIIGSGRSGTSVLTWCLGQHPNILPLPETHWIARLSIHMRQLYQFGTVHDRYTHLGALDWTEEDFYAEFGRAVDRFIVDTREPRLRSIRKLAAKERGVTDIQVEELERNGKLSPDPALVSARNYQVVRSPDDPKGRWVDGGPENTFYMLSLSRLFPGAKFIHILRDPNDVARSFMRFSQAGEGGTDYSEGDAYRRWQRYVEYAIKGEKALGRERVFRVRYETLVSEPEKILRSCLEFLGEAFVRDTLLPLQERINSSKIECTVADNIKSAISEGKEANEFYQSILETQPGEPDMHAKEELVAHFESYAAQINVR